MLKKYTGRLILKIMGFSANKNNTIPAHKIPKQSIIAIGPHTSKSDGLGVLAISISKLIAPKISIVYRDKKRPGLRNIGWRISNRIFNGFGGIKIMPNENKNSTEQIKEHLTHKKNNHALMSIDGHRRKREHINSGFYHIAKDLNLPIILISVCYKTKKHGIKLLDPIPATKKDMIDIMQEFYKNVRGKVPSQESTLIFKNMND